MMRLNSISTRNNRAGDNRQLNSAITFASIRKIIQKSDMIENRSVKNPPIFFEWACTMISYTARETGELNDNSAYIGSN
jgi:hypothetical protein